jgi:hypothetical protein
MMPRRCTLSQRVLGRGLQDSVGWNPFRKVGFLTAWSCLLRFHEPQACCATIQP